MNPMTQRLMGAAMTWGMASMAGRFLREAASARQVADKTLDEILSLNGATEWGRRWGLDGPDRRAAFAAMPVTTYEDYRPYVERAAAGAANVLTQDPITYFAVTSGTTGPQKWIPVTRRQTRTIMRNMLVPMGMAIRTGLLGTMRGRMLQIMTEQVTGTTPGGIPMGAATSGGLQKMERFMGLVWTSPMPVIRIQDQVAARYLHLLFALGEERLWSIVSFFPSTLLFVLRDLHARALELIRDVAEGRITPDLDLPTGVRADLEARLRPNPERARRLTHLLEHGRFTVRAIWPEVGAILTAGSGAFRFYLEQLRPYLGGIPVFSPVYAASEGPVGIGLSPDRPGYVIAASGAYHEFLPLSEADQPGARPLAMGQVEVGGEYELVMTTYAGLTRYRLGDVVRVLGRHGQAPVVEFVERRGQVINVVGEKTGEAHVTAAFSAACRETGAAVVDYVVTPDPDHTPARYLLLMEGLTGPMGPAQADQLLAAFERHLRRVAPDYSDSRRLGELAPPAGRLLKPGAFERYRDARVAAGASAAQVKVPHVVPDPSFARRHFRAETLTQIEMERAG